MPALAVLPGLGVVTYLFATAPESPVEDLGSAPVVEAPREPGEGAAPSRPGPASGEVDAAPERFPAAVGVDPDTLMSRIVDRRALPDSIGVVMERRLPGESTVVDYLVWLPPGLERDDREWPVILYLHGRSLRGEDPARVLRYGLPRYLAEGRSVPFIVVAPQQRPPGGWRDADRLAELLDAIEDRYPVDEDRIYLTGYSLGGGGVWRTAFEHGDRFAAAVPFAATTPAPTPERIEAIDDLPILIWHGTADEVAPVGAAVDMAEALERAGGAVELRLVEGADHGDLTTVYREPDLYAWMLAHER